MTPTKKDKARFLPHRQLLPEKEAMGCPEHVAAHSTRPEQWKSTHV